MFSHQSWSEWFPESEAEYQERFRRSRQMTPEEKLSEGIRLFEKECEMRRQAIRDQHPDMTDVEVDQVIAAQNEEWRRRDGKDYGIEVLRLIP